MHQANGACAGMCTCIRTHQMEKTEFLQQQIMIKTFCYSSGIWFSTSLFQRLSSFAEMAKLAALLNTGLGDSKQIFLSSII